MASFKCFEGYYHPSLASTGNNYYRNHTHGPSSADSISDRVIKNVLQVFDSRSRPLKLGIYSKICFPWNIYIRFFPPLFTCKNMFVISAFGITCSINLLLTIEVLLSLIYSRFISFSSSRGYILMGFCDT